jgi:hypothetical protein
MGQSVLKPSCAPPYFNPDALVAAAFLKKQIEKNKMPLLLSEFKNYGTPKHPCGPVSFPLVTCSKASFKVLRK